jgi:hypothetical protein
MADPDGDDGLYVVAHDSRPGAFGETAIPLSRVQSLYERTLRGRRVFSLVDAARGDGSPATVKANRANDQWLRLAAESGFAMAAAGSGQVSDGAAGRNGLGLFAALVKQGLDGAADEENGNRDGTVDAGELQRYIGREHQRAVPAGPYSLIPTPRALGVQGYETFPMTGRAVVDAKGGR